MATVLPTLTDGTQAYSFRSQLGNAMFGLDFAWNSIGGFWTLILSDSDGVPLVSGVIRAGVFLLSRYRDLKLPPGDIVAIDTSGEDEDPGLQDLGGRVQLVYLSADDLAAALA